MLPKAATSEHGLERLEQVVDLIEIAGRMPAPTVVVPGGDRVEDLELVESARDHGIANRVILVGNKARIQEAVAQVGIEVADDEIVGADGDEEVGKATVALVKAGKADIVLKGGISTPAINKHMLSLAVRPTVSLATIFDAISISDGRPMVLTDAGFTTVCNFGRMQDLVRNAVEVAQTVMGVPRPRVAILSANEKQIPSLPSTWMGLEMAKRAWPGAVLCGPLSFDLATDPSSVSIKGMPKLPNAEEVCGRADVLVCPGIDAANILYKTIAAMNKYGDASLAGITVGFQVPYVILSRSDSLETRLTSIALCAVYAQRNPHRKAEKKATVSVPAPEGSAAPAAQSAGAPDGAAADCGSGASVLLSASARAAAEIGLPLEQIHLVVVDLDHTVTVAAVKEGKVVDQALLPMETLDALQQAAGANDESALAAADALVYQIAKETGRGLVAAGCDVEAIVLAGRLASSAWLRSALRRRVQRLAPVIVV